MSGIDALKAIRQQRPRLPVVIFSMHGDREYCLRALRAGALGYVTKEGAPEEIAEAIEAVVAGRRYVSPGIAEYLFGAVIGAATSARRTRPSRTANSRSCACSARVRRWARSRGGSASA